MKPAGPPIPIRLLHAHSEPLAGLSCRRDPDDGARSAPRAAAASKRRTEWCWRWSCPPARSSIRVRCCIATRRRAYVVAAADEEVLVVRPRDIAEAARVGHLIGNMHRDIHVDGERIVALADETLARPAGVGWRGRSNEARPVSRPCAWGARALMRDLTLLALLQLFDSQFPVGAFAHSGGLETYAASRAALPELRSLMTQQIALGWGAGELAAASWRGGRGAS